MKKKEIFDSPFRQILFCTDFSENADFAFDFAIDAAIRRNGCRLHLLHIVPESDAQFWKSYIYEVENVDNKAKRDIDEAINKKYRSKTPPQIELVAAVKIGGEAAEILDYAKKQNIDLIILGRQGKNSLSTVLFGNVTEKVARHAECAVLIVPLAYKEKMTNSN